MGRKTNAINFGSAEPHSYELSDSSFLILRVFLLYAFLLLHLGKYSFVFSSLLA